VIIRDSRNPRGRQEVDPRGEHGATSLSFPVAAYTGDGKGVGWHAMYNSKRPAPKPTLPAQRNLRYVVLRCDGCGIEFKRRIVRGANYSSKRHWCTKNCRARTQMREKYIAHPRAHPSAQCHPDRPNKAHGMCRQCYGAKMKREARARKAASQ
jgi:hypothetical protein